MRTPGEEANSDLCLLAKYKRGKCQALVNGSEEGVFSLKNTYPETKNKNNYFRFQFEKSKKTAKNKRPFFFID